MSVPKPLRLSRTMATPLLLALILSGCQLLDDYLLRLPRPTRPLPTGVCEARSMSEDAIDPLTLGAWTVQLPDEAGLTARRFVIPVPAHAHGVEAAFPHGPDSDQNRYATVRRYTGFDCDGLLGVVWTSVGSEDVLLTLFDPDTATHATTTLPADGQTLVAAGYGSGHLYYLTLERGAQEPERAAGLTLHRYALFEVPGQPHASRVLDTSRDQLDVIVSDHPSVGHASMRVMGSLVAVTMGRLTHAAGDGLNHQGGFLAMFDTNTLAPTSSHRETSNPSFGNLMTVADSGEFLALDLGSNLPRGVQLHRFQATSRLSRVVYTVKTLHGITPQNPAGATFDVFDEISDEETTYYRWSNDHDTYAELGAVVELDAGYAVLFVGEPDEQGGGLDNARARGDLHDARDIGLVLVTKDFGGAWHGARNFLTDDQVLSHGDGSVTEEGAFYDFNGARQVQRNTGLRWLTDHQDPEAENASRLQAFAIGDDAILVLWEQWSRHDYLATRFMVVSGHGQVLTPPSTLAGGQPVRLSRTDDPVTVAGRTYLISGQGENLLVDEWAVSP